LWSSLKLAIMSSNSRAVRYRRLALAEPDPEKSKLLQLIADEAERGVLVTAEWMTPGKSMGEPPKA
jgi:LmbE family N-acetylglucosaminyl deacetylase